MKVSGDAMNSFVSMSSEVLHRHPCTYTIFNLDRIRRSDFYGPVDRHNRDRSCGGRPQMFAAAVDRSKNDPVDRMIGHLANLSLFYSCVVV